MIVCRDVWKIYGTPEQLSEAIALARKGALDRRTAASRIGCVVAVAGVSFSVRAGEIFCIMGLSGSGKSTLLRHLNRLIEPSMGSIIIAGEDIGSKNPVELRKLRSGKIGMVFQDMALWPHMTVGRNVAYGLEIAGAPKSAQKEAVENFLDLVQLSEWADRYPDELSGGMKQRVGLARALATRPDLLLLDEPFSALDPLIRQQLQSQFLRIAGIVNKTAVFITHDLHEAVRIGHRIAIMKDGRFIQVGTPEHIVLHPKDDYVRDFVRGIPRLNLVRAGSIMEPLKSGDAAAVARLEGPRVPKDAKLDSLLELASEADRPLVVVDADSRPVGTIGHRSLFRAVRDAM